MDLLKSYSEIIDEYINYFPHQNIVVESRREFLKSTTHFPGVYIVENQGEVIYIGSSGKLNSKLDASKSTVKSRLSNSYTPYKLDDTYYKYSPIGKKAGTNKPMDYRDSYPLNELQFRLIDLSQNSQEFIAPSALEHILLQAFINEFKCLPVANQKL